MRSISFRLFNAVRQSLGVLGQTTTVFSKVEDKPLGA